MVKPAFERSNCPVAADVVFSRFFFAALDIDSQKGVAKQIEELLLDETPIVFPYFYYFLSAAKKNLLNTTSAATGQFDLSKAGFTS